MKKINILNTGKVIENDNKPRFKLRTSLAFFSSNVM